MRWLEGTPARYDAGMRALTFGRVDALHAAVAEAAAPAPGARVLEVGCGTGAVTERLLARGAVVTALDASAEMMERARARVGEGARVEWLERTASEIDALPPGAYDAVVFSLSL
ncbi:MAG: class I SAM-dependent methyltransferase, partial [Myxococcales bacterium]|nr:class I SAM-dependent methyltransferase [Myxococcales bacterium]